MANKVSFIIQLKDQFGGVAKKVNKQFGKIKQGSAKAGRSIKNFSRIGASSFNNFSRKSTAALTRLKNGLTTVDNTIERQFRNIEESAARANRRMKEFEKRGENIRKIGKKFAKAGAVMSAAITLPAALIGRSMIAAASDATETANKFNSVFDDVRGKANQVADDFAKSFGTARSTSRKLIGDTGDLLVGFGFTGDAALELSRKVNELAADLTSFQNVEGGVKSASAALTKALLGETESAKSLGIVIRQTDKKFRTQVKTIARVKGITEQQAKAIVILNQATRQSRKAIGDVTRTWDDYASVVRRNEESTKELSESFGKLMIPLATKLVNRLTKLTKAVDSLSPGMKKIVLIVTGFLAIGGPLLLLLSGIAIAFSVITLPILLVGAAIIGLITAGTLLIVRWGKIVGGLKALWSNFSQFITDLIDSVSNKFNQLWEDVITGLKVIVNKGIRLINKLLTPLSTVKELLGFGELKIPELKVAVSKIDIPELKLVAPNIDVPELKLVAPNIDVPELKFKIPKLRLVVPDIDALKTKFEGPDVAGLQVPVTPNGRLDGQITVAAAPGAEIKETKLKTEGTGLNIGMNMALVN